MADAQSGNAPVKGKRLYHIVFQNQGNVYEIHARKAGQGERFAFVEVEDILPLPAVVRIDAVE